MARPRLKADGTLDKRTGRRGHAGVFDVIDLDWDAAPDILNEAGGLSRLIDQLTHGFDMINAVPPTYTSQSPWNHIPFRKTWAFEMGLAEGKTLKRMDDGRLVEIDVPRVTYENKGDYRWMQSATPEANWEYILQPPRRPYRPYVPRPQKPAPVYESTGEHDAHLHPALRGIPRA